MRGRSLGSWALVGLVLVFLFFPVVIVVLFSFNARASTSLPFTGFSLRWYDAAFSNALFRASLKNSAIVAGITAALAALIGVSASCALSRRRSRVLDLFSTFVTVPLIVPALVLAVALLSFFHAINIRLSLTTVIIAHTLVTLPFVVLIVNARLMRLDRSIEEAARDLGASSFQAFRKIVFPLVRPAVFGAVLITVAWSFDEFVITFFTIGGQTTLPVMIWGMLRRGLDPTVNAIATVIFLTSITVTVVAAWLIGSQVRIRPTAK